MAGRVTKKGKRNRSIQEREREDVKSEEKRTPKGKKGEAYLCITQITIAGTALLPEKCGSTFIFTLR